MMKQPVKLATRYSKKLNNEGTCGGALILIFVKLPPK